MLYVVERIGDSAILGATAGLKTAWCPERIEDLSLEVHADAEDSSGVPRSIHCPGCAGGSGGWGKGEDEGAQQEVSEGQNGRGMNGTSSRSFSCLPLAAARQPPPTIPIALSRRQPKGQPRWNILKANRVSRAEDKQTVR